MQFPETLELALEPIGAVGLALYAAASGDLNPLHFGATALRALNTRFVGTAQLGDTLLLRATLAHVEVEGARYELSVQTAAGAPVVSGQARVAHSA